MTEPDINAEVLGISKPEYESPFIWVQVQFKDLKASPGKYCEVHIPLETEEVKDLDQDDITKLAITEATFFLARVLSFSYD